MAAQNGGVFKIKKNLKDDARLFSLLGATTAFFFFFPFEMRAKRLKNPTSRSAGEDVVA